MPLRHAVLALLAAKPTHGYQLRSSFEQAVGEQWGGLNIGHLYQILDRLARDGLIETERQPQPVKPDRLVRRLTPAGRAELDRWLSEPSVRPRGYRDDFFLKIVAAAESGNPALLAGVLSRQRLHRTAARPPHRPAHRGARRSVRPSGRSGSCFGGPCSADPWEPSQFARSGLGRQAPLISR